jgi:FkbM family methyltransferase
LNEDIIIVDLGACMGEFTNEMNKLYKVKKSIMVEANPTNFYKLENKENYVLYNKVIASENDKIVEFYEDSNSPYNGSNHFNYFNGIKHEIKSITLEKIIEENNLEYIDILKVDIEGSEYDVMPNIKDETYSIIRQITIEFHDFIDVNLKSKTQEIINKLKNLGFSHVSKPIVYMNNSDNYDVLFFKK